jgi:hypothetical protein
MGGGVDGDVKKAEVAVGVGDAVADGGVGGVRVLVAGVEAAKLGDADLRGGRDGGDGEQPDLNGRVDDGVAD